MAIVTVPYALEASYFTQKGILSTMFVYMVNFITVTYILSLEGIYIYIYIYICVCMYVYIYILFPCLYW